ncbi:hypothetical protein HME9302_02380 [Alteripontixanthobacter maritimus]|uniref:DUF1491 family protein n=1 Tax=Alteripontixanthobacter maritimus TaxID=2161824 RepID=A0A369Q8E6_9SPHN|nr:DUF1491 family protein [Alteripontixanthobacter maritimus]RDC61161.1 hypothetical protein HME9302_02380 [Alteripontixanthobacter maritimus]
MTRLPAHLEASAILRLVSAQGGFGTVIAKGERDAGTIVIIVMPRGAPAQFLERMPELDGSRSYTVTRIEDPENKQEFSDYLARRQRQDRDLWILEADVEDAARFTATLPD